MERSAFDQNFQHGDVPSKIVAGLERISEAFRVMLWEHAKVIGLSPIQIQLVIFIAYHPDSLCNVSQLAREFNLTKPTVSDAVRVLEQKGLIEKATSAADKRAYSILLTPAGQNTVQDTEHFANPIRQSLERLPAWEQEQLFAALSKVIFGLNRSGILTVQRTCYGCRFYEKKQPHHFCHLMKKELLDADIRLDCPEFEEKS